LQQPALIGRTAGGRRSFQRRLLRRLVLVQTFGINATKRSGTLRGSCGENSIPDFWRPLVFDAKLSKFELTFPDSVHQINAGDDN